MNVEINEARAYFEKKGSDWVRAVGKKALTAVFNCLHQGIFLNAATVYENVDLLSVVSVDAWFSNYKRIAPVGCSVIFLSA